ncbi:hypothetical protein [Lonepinella koalarum]|uniref:hypothetical protein n=1 Tax=Lonepinella koalarum TaxID=53417 RepID=UPI0018939DF4|nr:hypothetical protein [Lonepinella koalarum]
MDNISLILPLIKELIMQYGLWQMAFAISLPVFIFILPKLIKEIINLIRILR